MISAPKLAIPDFLKSISYKLPPPQAPCCRGGVKAETSTHGALSWKVLMVGENPFLIFVIPLGAAAGPLCVFSDVLVAWYSGFSALNASFYILVVWLMELPTFFGMQECKCAVVLAALGAFTRLRGR